ncbi:MAG: tRNA (adenosine(37)-N6)-threonylcarbamoyltransferase complex dimerization subunit type 1 TsaB [Bacteroidales bacterium]|nr:tRNA (adenosine(37)-N6)-threonylcarbamoyltransferase complex dimerization subunit type 1 TsaB [Bacteroidales bacterium]
MARILNIDTATPVCSVALCDGAKVLSYTDSAEEKAHASHLGVYIEKMLQTEGIGIKQLDAVAVSKGPGSFTGLRIGVSVAKGISYAADIPLIAVDTLQAMAFGMVEMTKRLRLTDFDAARALYCPMIDARRMEVYTALYDSQLITIEAVNAKIINGQSFETVLRSKKIVFAGTGAAKCMDSIKNENAVFLTDFMHSSRFMNMIAQSRFNKGIFENVAYFEPYYLKDFVATVAKRKVI